MSDHDELAEQRRKNLTTSERSLPLLKREGVITPVKVGDEFRLA